MSPCQPGRNSTSWYAPRSGQVIQSIPGSPSFLPCRRRLAERRQGEGPCLETECETTMAHGRKNARTGEMGRPGHGNGRHGRRERARAGRGPLPGRPGPSVQLRNEEERLRRYGRRRRNEARPASPPATPTAPPGRGDATVSQARTATGPTAKGAREIPDQGGSRPANQSAATAECAKAPSPAAGAAAAKAAQAPAGDRTTVAALNRAAITSFHSGPRRRLAGQTIRIEARGAHGRDLGLSAPRATVAGRPDHRRTITPWPFCSEAGATTPTSGSTS